MAWKHTFARRNNLKRINARMEHDIPFDDHFFRGKASMHLRIAGSTAIMLANALGYLGEKLTRQDAQPGDTARCPIHATSSWTCRQRLQA